MHGTVMKFISLARESHPAHFAPGVRVLEFGSLNINGSPRELFTDPGEYIGIDCHGGRGVDVVGICHEFEHDVGEFDVVISTEMLEHDPYWEKTLKHASDMLRVGGLLVLTCASPARPEHNLEDSPIPGYYGGLGVSDVQVVLESACAWNTLEVRLDRWDFDLIVHGIKA